MEVVPHVCERKFIEMAASNYGVVVMLKPPKLKMFETEYAAYKAA